MPYISRGLRPGLDAGIEQLVAALLLSHDSEGKDASALGSMNYIFSRIMALYLMLTHEGDEGIPPDPITYERLKNVRAVLSDASAEFYRRIMEPYEDGKIETNGDVFSELLAVMRK